MSTIPFKYSSRVLETPLCRQPKPHWVDLKCTFPEKKQTNPVLEKTPQCYQSARISSECCTFSSIHSSPLSPPLCPFSLSISSWPSPGSWKDKYQSTQSSIILTGLSECWATSLLRSSTIVDKCWFSFFKNKEKGGGPQLHHPNWAFELRNFNIVKSWDH